MIGISVGEWLARHEQLTPEKIGLVDIETQQRLTYRTLNLRARALAAFLQEQYSIEQGDRVAILAFNAPAYLNAFFACALLGAIFVPLNVRFTTREFTVILADCKPKLLLHDEAHIRQAIDIATGLQVGDSTRALHLLPFSTLPEAAIELAKRAVPFQLVDGEEIALILYTSGTTGIPKGAMLSHRMLTWNAINTQVSWGLRDDDITPTFAPFFHAGGLNVPTPPLYHCGGTVVLLRTSEPSTVLSTLAAL